MSTKFRISMTFNDKNRWTGMSMFKVTVFIEADIFSKAII